MVAILTESEKRFNVALGKGRPAWDGVPVNLGARGGDMSAEQDLL